MHSETEVLEKIKNLLMEKPKGMTTEDIAKSLPLNRTSTAKYLNTLLISGQIQKQVVGRAKLFTCCNRLPLSQMLSYYVDPVIVMDHERMVREINPKFIETFGIPGQDLIGKKFDLLPSGVDITRLLMPGICQAVDGRSVTKNHEIKNGGEVLHFRTNYLPVVLPDGRPGAAVILEDVTETTRIQQKYEKEIREHMTGGESANTGALSVVSQHNAGSPSLGTGRIPVHQVLDTLPDLVLEIDSNLQPGFVSPSHQAALGYSPEEYRNMDFMDLIHPIEREQVISAIKEARDNKKTTTQEFRIRHKEGHYIWLESVGKPVYDAAGTFIGGVISSRDVSDRVCQAEAIHQNYLALQENVDTLLAKEQEVQSNIIELSRQRDLLHKNEEIFHGIFDNAYDAIFLVRVNPDGTPGEYIDANEAACRLLGYTRKELLGKSAGDILSRTPRSTILAIITRRISTPSNGWFDVTYTRNDGKVVPVEASVAIIPSGAEKVAMVTVREIVEREQAEDALSESEEKYRNLFEISPDPVFIHCDGTIVFANPATLNLLGVVRPEEVTGKKILDFIHPDFRKTINQNIEKDLAVGGSPTSEVHMLRADGTTVIVEGRGVRTSVDGRPAVLVAIRDITVRKQAEKKILETEQNLKAIFEAAEDGMLLADIETQLFMMANPAIQKLTGYTEAELLNLTPSDIHPPADLPHVVEQFEKQVRGEITLAPGLPVLRKDGTVFYCDVNSSLFVHRGRKTLLGIFRDITDRKAAEEALAESEEKYRLISENTADLIWVFDMDLHLTYVNYAVKTMRGFTVEEVMGQTLDQMMTPESVGAVIKLFNEELALEATGNAVHDRPIIIETDFYSKDGPIIRVENTIRFLRKADGTPYAILGVSHDITKRKQAEEGLRESEEKYRLLTEQVNDAIYIYQEGHFLYANTPTSGITGYSPEELLAIPLIELVHPGDRAYIRDLHERRSRGEPVPGKYEFRIIHRNGSFLHVEANTINIPYRGSYATLGVVRDITDRKQAEEELRQITQQLNLLTDITRHDILDKVTAITGHLSLARKKFSDPGITALIDTIDANTNEIKSQIEFTKVYQALGTQEPQWQNPEYIINQLHVPSNITVQSSLKGVEIFADPLFSQVYFNLLDNAGRHGGHVTTITLSMEQNRFGLTILCEDNGMGIPGDKKKNIFKRGFGKGTGPGLFLLQEALMITGIKIRENGIPGQGARFEIIVPKGAFRTTPDAVPR